MCDLCVSVCVCVEAAGGGGGGGGGRADEDLKTRTPHNDVGKKEGKVRKPHGEPTFRGQPEALGMGRHLV